MELNYLRFLSVSASTTYSSRNNKASRGSALVPLCPGYNAEAIPTITTHKGRPSKLNEVVIRCALGPMHGVSPEPQGEGCPYMYVCSVPGPATLHQEGKG